jgi:hypothetical protein
MAMLDHSRLDLANHHFYYGDRYIEHLERWLGERRVATRTLVMDWNDNKQSGEILDHAMFATLEPRTAWDARLSRSGLRQSALVSQAASGSNLLAQPRLPIGPIA